MTGQTESKVFVMVLFYLLLGFLSICFTMFSETFSIVFLHLFFSPDRGRGLASQTSEESLLFDRAIAVEWRCSDMRRVFNVGFL